MDIVALVIFVIAVIFVVRSIKIVPQQHAWVVERLGRYSRTLAPGLSFLMPFVDRVAYKHGTRRWSRRPAWRCRRRS